MGVNYRLIATTKEIDNPSVSFYKDVKNVYANESWGRYFMGRDHTQKYNESDRMDLVAYLYSRLHVHPKYWVYEYCFRRKKWILLEEIE